jgi:FkbM family methyltransferase
VTEPANKSLRKDLLMLLDEPLESARARAGSEFDRRRGKSPDRLILFGAGGLGRLVLKGLRQEGVDPTAFADNNPSFWGKTIEGLPVLSPQDAAHRWSGDASFIVTIWRAGGTHRFDRTCLQLRDLGVVHVAHAGHLFWKYPQRFLPYYAMDLPDRVLEDAAEIIAAYDLLADDRSRRLYVEQVRWRLHLDFECLSSPGPEPQYFPPDLYTWSAEEVFVDVGAFDGDTLRETVKLCGTSFKRIVALEPDPLNYERLATTTKTLPQEVRGRVETHPVAVGDAPGRLCIDPLGLPSSATGSGNHEVDCFTLDGFLAKHELRPTFIKMDIEGAELGALHGSCETIRQQRPMLAICAYHLQNHLWKIPLYINEIASDYRIHYRSHNEEVWDFVCYAIPSGR